MTKRFDRTVNGEKIHMQTMAGIANMDRDFPQNYESLFIIANYLKLPYSSQEEIFRRMVFNVMARNHDDHTKNHSFLMYPSGKWELSPAYDLCYSYNPTGKFTKHHQMYLNGKNDEFTYKDLETVALKNNIHNYKQIIEQVAEGVSKWEVFAKESHVMTDVAKFINKNLLVTL
jgi:serine/threonine-protein kinase HipA